MSGSILLAINPVVFLTDKHVQGAQIHLSYCISIKTCGKSTVNTMVLKIVMEQIEFMATPIYSDLVRRTFDQSSKLFDQYNSAFDTRKGLLDIDEPFGLFFSKFDFWVSVIAPSTNKDIQSLINQSFKGPLKTYMLACHQEGYIGRFGGTVSPSSYSLNFPASNVSLLWIPKNGCTTLKRSLVELEPLEAQKHIKIKKIHKTCQKHFGLTHIQYARGKLLPKICAIRHPYERIVSCYLDKFANPVMTNTKRGYEFFVVGHVENAQSISGIPTDLSRSISFLEFLNYIRARPRWSYDAHWRPQVDFLPDDHSNITFGSVRNLPGLLASVGIGEEIKSHNPSYGGKVTSKGSGKFAKTLPQKLSDENLEDYGDFLSDECLEILNVLYGDDIRLYDEMIDS